MLFNYQVTNFFLSVPSFQDLPNDSGIEVAFIGYSNVGKSSVINNITNQKKLARTSKMPGSTKLINIFQISEGYRLVDFPGYGYTATISKKLQFQWKHTLDIYLKKRRSLKGIILIMDIRYPFKLFDELIIRRAVKYAIPVLLLLNKADKYSLFKRKKQLDFVRQKISIMFIRDEDVQVDFFSARKKMGIENIHRKLDNWFNFF
ncbi:MAG: ribosome biogenesis GTP-binding protein YihA/YsxC [Candidatus Dasytiphilus stammeri]